MKKEIWGVNVIGQQGVNAENDFAIMANDAGDDVVVKIKDAELTGAEFATLKEIAEGGPTPGGGGFPEQDLNDPTFVPEANHYYQQKDGEQPEPESQFTDGVLYFYDGEEYHAITGEGGEGGGMPDPTDANDGDVIKVTVTPAEYEADPKVAVGDVLTDLWALNSIVPDLSQLSYDDHRFEQSMGSAVADLMRGTYTVTKHGESQELTFTIAAVSVMGINGILMLAGQTPEQEQPNDVIFYVAGAPKSPDGWVTGAPLQDGYANLMVMPFDRHPHLPELTITELANQDVWCKWIGKQKPFAKVRDEIKESGWGKPYPAFTKADQVLTSAGESYMLMPTNKDIPLSGSGRFYFNTDLSIDQMDENLGMMVRDGMSGMKLQIFNTKDKSDYTLFIGGKKDEHDEYVVRYITYSKDPGTGDDPTLIWVYATADYDFDAEGTTIHMTHGWNQEEINNCTWDGDSYTYVDAIHSDYSMVLSIYGSIFTIQEGLYYGDVKNAHLEWKAPIDSLDQLKLDPNEMDSWAGSRSNQNFVVYNSTDDKPHYMSMDDVKEEISGSISHKYLHHIRLEGSNMGNKGQGCTIAFDFVADTYTGVTSVNQLLALKNFTSVHTASGVFYVTDANTRYTATAIELYPDSEHFKLYYVEAPENNYYMVQETFDFNEQGATYHVNDSYIEQL